MGYEELSNQILDVSLEVNGGDTVWINGWDHTANLVRALVKGCRRRGCEAIATVQREGAWFHAITVGPKAELTMPSAEQLDLLDRVDSYVFTLGPRRPVDWAKIPADRLNLVTIWFLEQNSFVREWMSIAKRRRVKMLGVEATLATQERAEALGFNYGAWRRVMHSGCLADTEEMRRRVAKISSHLGGQAQVRITSPSGTDITFDLDGRAIEESDGTVSDQKAKSGTVVFLPAGWVGTTVDETSAEGSIVYDNPIRSPAGSIRKLTVRLRSGRIVDYRAAAGVEAFERLVESAKGDSDRFAFFGVGLNSCLRLGYGQDDKVLGSVELNFGESRSRGGKNRGDRNWWGTIRGATITVGGRRIMDDGALLV